MSDVTWGVCSKQRTVTVFCMDCQEVLHLHAPMVEALELKAAAAASHQCHMTAVTAQATTGLFGFPMEQPRG